MQRGLCLEEPDAGNLLVRVCGGAAWVTSGPTRKIGVWMQGAAPSALIFMLTIFPGLTAGAPNAA